MKILRNVPIKRKLTIISLVTSCTALLLTCGLIVGYELHSFRRDMVEQALTTARIVGANCAAALTFDDPEAATLTLASLAANRHITAAFIYDAKGKPFASYSPPGTLPTTAPDVRKDSYHVATDHQEVFNQLSYDYLELFLSIRDEGEVVGTICVRQDMLKLQSNLVRLGLLFLGIIAASLLVALWLTRRFLPLIAGPILALERVVREVGVRRDFSIRAVKQGDDEVGTLIDGFNWMLDRMEQHDSDLETERSLLEQRVGERTAQLASSLSVLNATIESTADGIMAIDLAGFLVCNNSRFAQMWGIPEEMLKRKDNAEMIEFVSHQIEGAEQFMRGVSERSKGQGLPHCDILQLKDGRTFERMIQPQLSDGQTVGRVLNFRDITERRRAEAELEEANKLLLETSRQAGMAEVATSVLHNVGNVLNSVNISCSLVAEKVRKSRIGSVARTADLLHAHADDLVEFLTSNPAGRQLPDYLGKLSERMKVEQAEVIEELNLLVQNIEHIKDIVAMQQSYSKVSGVTETILVTDLVEDSLRMNHGALIRHEVEIVREFSDVPQVTTEKHKALQILVNLIRNAKDSCKASGHEEKRVIMRVSRCDDFVRVDVIDNGAGIARENLTRIFAHGFTTKKDGHGYGLHSGANAAREMGGSLTVHSDGLGTGATFTLLLPLLPAASVPTPRLS